MDTNSSFSYIKSIKLNNFCGSNNLVWNLSRGVNILSGGNGSGKSTLIYALTSLLTGSEYKHNPYKPIGSIEVELENGITISSNNSTPPMNNVSTIATFDTSIIMGETLRKLSGDLVNTDLDWELYKVLNGYLKYQLKLGKKAIDILISGNCNTSVDQIMLNRNKYYDIIDSLFSSSNKSVIRDSDELKFKNGDITLSPYQLSSGEKQLIILLTTVLIQDYEPYIMILDEPEISLHHEWQQKLLENTVALNPNVQVIVATHSPAVIMNGWLDRVVDISDILT